VAPLPHRLAPLPPGHCRTHLLNVRVGLRANHNPQAIAKGKPPVPVPAVFFFFLLKKYTSKSVFKSSKKIKTPKNGNMDHVFFKENQNGR
jgi:hypothetical protein